MPRKLTLFSRLYMSELSTLLTDLRFPPAIEAQRNLKVSYGPKAVSNGNAFAIRETSAAPSVEVLALSFEVLWIDYIFSSSLARLEPRTV